MFRTLSSLAAVLLCLASLSAGAAWADDKHLPVGPGKTRIQGLALPPGPPRRPVNPRETSHLILEEDRPLRWFDLDQGLTELCRLGRFRQKQEHFLIVNLDGYIHGAVVGGHWSLYDPEGLAVPNLVYAVKGQDGARCEVYIIRYLRPDQ